MHKDKALELALEALETLVCERGSIYEKAIATIKAALKAPTSAEYAMGYAEGFDDGCKPVSAQDLEEGDWVAVNARWGKRFVEMMNPVLGGNNMARFYFEHPPAAQPTPKPLTEEQICTAFRSVFPVGGVIFTTGAIAFAKAIEAAHNIRG